MHIYNLIITDLEKFVNTRDQKEIIQNLLSGETRIPKNLIFLRPPAKAHAHGEIIKTEADKLAKQIRNVHHPVPWLCQLEKYNTDQIRLMLLNHKQVKNFQDKILIFGANKLINLETGNGLINEIVCGYPDYGWTLQIFEL
jgi:hypothetical protein